MSKTTYRYPGSTCKYSFEPNFSHSTLYCAPTSTYSTILVKLSNISCMIIPGVATRLSWTAAAEPTPPCRRRGIGGLQSHRVEGSVQCYDPKNFVTFLVFSTIQTEFRKSMHNFPGTPREGVGGRRKERRSLSPGQSPPRSLSQGN